MMPSMIQASVFQGLLLNVDRMYLAVLPWKTQGCDLSSMASRWSTPHTSVTLSIMEKKHEAPLRLSVLIEF